VGLTPGAHIGPYEVTALIGEGGMGEVYRATDPNLKRSIAIKVLPAPVSGDPDRLARFQREAEVLAALNDPHIAQIYGLEKSGGVAALVMELVEGETLADHIARGPIPVDEALPIARQIAEALEAAHDQGIIHRDLKPANIKVRPDGTVKVLDFGLAKLAEPGSGIRDAGSEGARAAASLSPTITSPALMTGVGVLLGTAAYMSPEQAKGKPADKRSDIWAFGCVLYEMLTGKRCFDGEDVAETLAFVLTKEPDWGALPSTTPLLVANLLRRCLERDRRKRAGDIVAALFAIDEAGAVGTSARGSATANAVREVWLWRRLAVSSVPALIAGLIIAGGSVWVATRPEPPRVSRLAIMTTPATGLTVNNNDRDLAITPDGSRVVYVGNNGRDLFVRALDAVEPLRLFTGAPRAPFLSPDSQWVGFIDAGNVLKKVALAGGPPVTIAVLDGNSRGATWTSDDTIVFATLTTATGLQQVPAAGGRTSVLTRPDRERGDFDHQWPEVLPGGQVVLYTVLPVSGGLEAAQIMALDRRTGTQKVVVRGGTHAHYVRSGHIVYAVGNTLQAVAFDRATLETRGTPVPILADVMTTRGAAAGGMDAVVASDGTLAYVRGAGDAFGTVTLAWVDRQGQETPIPVPPRDYSYPRISPDGSRVALWAADQESDIWTWDFKRLTLTRLTFSSEIDLYPVWSPDSRRVLFTSGQEGGTPNLFWRAADGTGAVERLTRSTNTQTPTAISPDGSHLIFTETMPKTAEDVMQVEVTGSHTVAPLVQSSFSERNGIISPDGRWLAYEANDSGQFEIYARPYPDVAGGRWQVSSGGGTRPLWSRNGEELFYLSPGGSIMGVGIERDASWAATTPTTIVKAAYAPLGAFPGRTYDVASDGQRFLVFKSTNDPTSPAPQIVVVQHFDEMLKRLVPRK